MIDLDLSIKEHRYDVLRSYLGKYQKYFQLKSPGPKSASGRRELLVTCGYEPFYAIDLIIWNKQTSIILYRRYSILKKVDLLDPDGPVKIQQVLSQVLKLKDRVNVVKIDPTGPMVDIHSKDFDGGDLIIIEFEKKNM